ncbi:hypothetical protein AWH56_011350 [Anaerobacillus isosaccharinicus]|uniref:Uncharacterized protein n=1 Tax=Anaerobacillus isosaccharinicus TaxID=1532552 RepID=A0A7S7RDH1_9BACI|nr:hypothetical protein [Anaerobacillus isosaccharinicus]
MNDRVSILQASTTVLYNLSRNMKSDDINSEYLVEQSALFITFGSLIPEYAQLAQPLSDLIGAINLNKISNQEINVIGETLNLKVRELLEILNLPSNFKSIDELLEKYNAEFTELNNIPPCVRIDVVKDF